MKKGKILGLFALSAMLLTGCVDSMPELTAEESDIITEYAASLILKYSPYYDYKIVSEEEVAAAKALEEVPPETAAEDGTEEQPEDGETSVQTEEAQQEEPQEPETEVIQMADDLDLAAELDIDDLILRYQSFELCDTYPQDNTGFQVNAQQGKKLLVVHFDLKGSDEEDVDCNMIDHEIGLRLNLNDTVSVMTLGTEKFGLPLPDALTAYMDVIPAGETVDVVAIAEVDDITEQAVETLVVQMTSAGGSCTARLK